MASGREGGFIASVFAVCVAFAAASVINIQVDDFADDSNIDATRLFPRSEASNKRTVWLFSGECISVTVCLPNEDILTISNIKFSNDGESDIVVVDIDENIIGSFNSSHETSFGSYWNIFADTGPIGRRVRLPAGKHVLTLTVVEADDYGVELDEISAAFRGNYGQDEILCPGNEAQSKCYSRNLQRSPTTIGYSNGGEGENEYSTTPALQDCSDSSCDTTDPATITDNGRTCNGSDCGVKNDDRDGSSCKGSGCDDKDDASPDTNGDVGGGRGSFNSGQQSNCNGNGCSNGNSEVINGDSKSSMSSSECEGYDCNSGSDGHMNDNDGATGNDDNSTVTSNKGNYRATENKNNEVDSRNNDNDNDNRGSGDNDNKGGGDYDNNRGSGDNDNNRGSGDNDNNGGGGDKDNNRGSGSNGNNTENSGNDTVTRNSGNGRDAGNSGNGRDTGYSGYDNGTGPNGNGRDTGNSGNDNGTGPNGNGGNTGNSSNGRDTGNSGNGRDTGNSGNGRDTGNSGNDIGNGRNGNGRNTGNSGNGRDTGNSGNDNGTGRNGNGRNTGNSGNGSDTGNSGNDNGTGRNGNGRNTGNSGNGRDTGDSGNGRDTGYSGNDNGTGRNDNGRDTGNSGNGRDTGNSGNDNGTGRNGNGRNTGNSGNDNGTGRNGNGRNTGDSGNGGGTGDSDSGRDTGNRANGSGTEKSGSSSGTVNNGKGSGAGNNGNDRDVVNNGNETPTGNSGNNTLSSTDGGDGTAGKNGSTDNITDSRGVLDVSGTGDSRNATTYDESYLFECPQRQIITMVRYSQLQCSDGMTRFDIFASDVTEIIMSVWKSSKDQEKHRTRRSVSEGNKKDVGDPMEVYPVWESGEREHSCATIDNVLEEDVIVITGNEKNKMFPVTVDPANTKHLTLTFNVNSTMQETIFGRSFSSIFTVGIRCMDKPAYISARFTDPDTNKSVELSPKRFTSSVTWQTWTFPFLIAGSGNFDMTLNFTNASGPFGLHFLRFDLQETFGSLLPWAFMNPTFGFGGNMVNLAKSDTTSLDGVEESKGPKMRVRMRGSGRRRQMTSLVLSSAEDGSAEMLPKFIFNQNGSALFYPDQSPDAQPVFVMGNDDSNGISPFPVMDISRVDIVTNNSAYELNIMTRSFRRVTVLVSIEGNKTTVNLKASPSIADQHSPLCSLMLPCWGLGYGKTAIISADGTQTMSMFSPWMSFKGQTIEMQRSQNVTGGRS